MTQITQETVDRECRKNQPLMALSRLSGILGAVAYLAHEDDRQGPPWDDFVMSLHQMRESLDEIYRQVEAI